MTTAPRTPHTANLIVSCPDRPGLVAALAQVLYRHGVNILDSDQHTDPTVGQFFQRIRFDLASTDASRGQIEEAVTEVADELEMEWRIAYGDEVKRVAIMVSKYDHCLHDLLWRHRAGELPCEVALIVSNHPDLEPVAQHFDVPFAHVPVTKATKAEAEAQQRALLEEHRADLIVLARYMQILSAGFVDAYPGRIINIHHSFLPAFVGGRPYHQAAERGVKIIGATAHYATADLDQGPIIEQDIIRASHRDTVQDLIRKGRDVERSVLARAVRWHLQDRILVFGNKTIVFE